MATNQASMARRQRERQRQQRRRDKIAKKMERREQKAAAGPPDLDDSIDWSSAVKEAPARVEPLTPSRLELGEARLGGGGGRGERPPESDPESGIFQGKRVARIYDSPSGHTVLVGRSAEENDILSLKLARPRDVFFHVSGQPGSHVIVLVAESGAELDRDTIRFAASLAAAFLPRAPRAR